jgi:gluconolactonase
MNDWFRWVAAVMILAGLAPGAFAQASEQTAPSGVYRAEEILETPKMTAAGLAWWKDRLLIADRGGKRVVAFTPPKTVEVLREGITPVGPSVDREGNWILSERDPSRIVRITPTGKVTVLAETDIGTPQFTAVHRSGTIFWSGFPDGGTRSLAPGGKPVVLAPRIGHTYGLGFSPKHDWLYVSSKLPNKELRAVWRFPLDEQGAAKEGKILFKVEDLQLDVPKLPPAKDGATNLLGWVGRLQGLAVDRLGHVYLAGAESHTSGEAVAVVDPTGKKVVAMILGVPRNISGLAFGGKDGRTLYITGAGEYRVYQVRLPVAGVGWE